jgi:hypothetical protein
MYHEKLTLVDVVENHKAIFVSEEEHEQEELNQCINCGLWCGQDDEHYGAGYCTKCCNMCIECEQYRVNHDLKIINGERICSTCIEAFKNTYPNSYKYHQAIDECPYAEAEDGDLKVQFEYIGEGLSGDYTGEEDDVPMMRFYTYKKEYIENGQGIDHPDWNWAEMEDGSWCTQVPVDTPKETLEKMTKVILEKMKEVVGEYGEDGIQDYNIRKVSSECSWIDESWIK